MVDLGINNDIIKDIQLVIFDKDGTIMDLYTYWSNMVSYRVEMARKKLGFDEHQKKRIMYAMGVDIENMKLREEGPVGLKKREIVMQAMVDALTEAGFPDTYDFCIEIFREVDKISVKFFPQIVKPINGMRKLIDRLCGNCKIAIATTDKTKRAKLATKFLGISDKVDVVIGADMVENCKPSPDMINLITKKMSVNKKNAVMIGDAITDIEMGINAKLIASIGVCSGLTPRKRLKEKTNYVIKDISEIKIIH